MKTIFLTFALGVCTTGVFAQDYKKPIGPVLNVAAEKFIHYPMGAIRGSVYGRFYTSFTIDATGKINDIKVVYPVISRRVSNLLGFEDEIKRGLYQVPKLPHAQAGTYLLPISFEYQNIFYGTNDIPTNKLPGDFALEGYQILNEIRIKARSDAYKSLRNRSDIPPVSEQIVMK